MGGVSNHTERSGGVLGSVRVLEEVEGGLFGLGAEKLAFASVLCHCCSF